MSISNTISIVEKIDRGCSTLHEIEIETSNIININVMIRPKPSCQPPGPEIRNIVIFLLSTSADG
jgi:hypothetical protein